MCACVPVCCQIRVRLLATALAERPLLPPVSTAFLASVSAARQWCESHQLAIIDSALLLGTIDQLAEALARGRRVQYIIFCIRTLLLTLSKIMGENRPLVDLLEKVRVRDSVCSRHFKPRSWQRIA